MLSKRYFHILGLAYLATAAYCAPQISFFNNKKNITAPDLNIDIDPLGRCPTLTPDRKYLKIGKKGAISSDLELCSNLTIQEVFLKYPESNAADAAVTQALCIGLINFFNSGIGGGGYAVFASSPMYGKHHLSLDFREQAPAASHELMFKDCPDCSKAGGKAIAVPGEIAGLYRLFKERGSGTVPWEDLIIPVANIAKNGWKVDEVLAAALKVYEPYLIEGSQANDWAFALNSTKNGVLKQGDLIKREKFGKVLEEIAKNGSSAVFYDPKSWIVQNMVKSIQEHNGIVTEKDFETYSVSTSKPLNLTIRKGFENMPDNDLTVLTSSGSSSGAALLSALRVLDNFPIVQGGDYLEEQSYQLIESMKWMASGRSRLGDYKQNLTKFGDEILPERIKMILKDEWINDILQLMKENSNNNNNNNKSYFKTLPSFKDYNPEYKMNNPHGTAHFSIIDKFGNAVSLTTTINLLFGSLVHSPETGVIFNNEMDDFSQPYLSNTFGLAASIYNFPGPGRRALSSAAPVVVLNELGKPDLVIGASGGSRITTSILQVLNRIYWMQMPLLESISYPRIHHQLLPDQLEVENISMVGKEMINNWKEMGHKVVEMVPKSVVNGIKYFEGEWHAVSDYWRKRGVSSVF